MVVPMLLAHLDIKCAVCGVQVLRPADERHPWLIIITILQGLTSILRVSHLEEQQQYTRSGHTAQGSTGAAGRQFGSSRRVCTQLLLHLPISQYTLRQCQHQGQHERFPCSNCCGQAHKLLGLTKSSPSMPSSGTSGPKSAGRSGKGSKWTGSFSPLPFSCSHSQKSTAVFART